MRQCAQLFCIVLSLFLTPALAAATTYQGKVVRVHDGDTLTLLTSDKRQIKVRLDEIDTPESRQPYGTKAKQALSDKVFGRSVTVKVETVDRYGRAVGHVILDGRDINREMVEEGFAWVYRRYVRDRSLFDAEQQAREAKRGLWSLREVQRVPPWEWRRGKRSGEGRASASQPKPARERIDFACGSKRFCSQMTSCEEARFYLEQCGLSRLDRDGDGRPCESLCR